MDNKIDYINFNDPRSVSAAEKKLRDLMNNSVVLSKKEIKWIIKYIFEKEKKKYGLDTDLKFTTYIEIFSKELLADLVNKNFSLQKTFQNLRVPAFFGNPETPLKSYISFNCENYYYDLFNNIDFVYSKIRILFILYHEIGHAVKNKRLEDQNKKRSLTLDEYIKYREDNITSCTDQFYIKNHGSFFSEIDANVFASDKTINYLKNNVPILYIKKKNKINNILGKNLNKKNLYDLDIFNEQYDINIKTLEQKGEFSTLALEDKKVLLEYNADGKRKDIYDTLNINPKEFNIDDDVFSSLIVNAINKNECIDIGKLDNVQLYKFKKGIIYGINDISRRISNNDYLFSKKLINEKQYNFSKEYLLKKYRVLAGYRKMLFTKNQDTNELESTGKSK